MNEFQTVAGCDLFNGGRGERGGVSPPVLP